jgi:hypothetical protein
MHVLPRLRRKKLNFICPNCGGDFVKRPVRPANLLDKYPASAERFYKPQGCATATQTA